MQSIFGTATSSAISRDGSIILPSALARVLIDRCGQALPYNLQHDRTRQLGWCRNTAVYIEPGLARLLFQAFIPESDNEREILNIWGNQTARLDREGQGADYQKLRSILASNLSNGAEERSYDGVSYQDKGILGRLFPELVELRNQDKSGLIPLAELDPLGPGVYQKGELMLFAHSYFRRSYWRDNSLNIPFLRRLQKTHQKITPVKIALDFDMVGLASSYRPREEMAYWWGPKFDDDLTSIQSGVARHNASPKQRFLTGITDTEFGWFNRDGEKTLEVEELTENLVEEPDLAEYRCRYVHSIASSESGVVSHLDGAIRAYDEEAFLDRIEVSLDAAGRNSRYTKLWRLDHAIDIKLWKALICDYYRDNRLVGEYLGAVSEERVDEDEAVGEKTPVQFDPSTFVPHALGKDSGVRVCLVAEKQSRLDRRAPRFCYSPTCLSYGDKTVNVVDGATIELIKAVRTRGGTFEGFPEKPLVAHVKDQHFNLGVVGHGSEATDDTLCETMEAIRELAEAWIAKGFEGSLAFTLGMHLGKKDLYLAVLGNLRDVSAWLASGKAAPPKNEEELFRWIDNVTANLKDLFPSGEKSSNILPAGFEFRGTLMERHQLHEVSTKVTDQGIAVDAHLSEAEVGLGLLDACKAGVIAYAPCYIVETSVCSVCESEYFDCPCCKTLSNDVVETLTGISSVIGFWTNPETVGAPA